MTQVSTTSTRSQILDLVDKSYASQKELLLLLNQLDVACSHILSFCHEHDFSPEVPGNGFRSLVKIIDLFFERVRQEHDWQNLRPDFQFMAETTVFARTLLKQTAIALMIRKKGTSYDASRVSEADIAAFDQLFQVTDDDVQPIYSQFHFFNIRTAFTLFQKPIIFTWHLLTSSTSERLKMLLNSSFCSRHRAKIATHGTSQTLKHLNPRFPISSGISLLNRTCVRGVKVLKKEIRCTNRFRLTVTGSVTRIQCLSQAPESRVEAFVILPPNPEENKTQSLVCNWHGGGFAIGDPEQFLLSMHEVARKFATPVIIPRYRKVPEHEFPSGLQDLLDVYLFLTSGDEGVADLIGFQPQRIILSGDSAGANLVMSTLFCLHGINKQFGHKVLMPDALCLRYPFFSPTFIAIPSYAMAPVDTIGSIGMLAAITTVYGTSDPRITHTAWQKSGTESVTRVMKSLKDRAEDPLFNSYAFNDWEDAGLRKIRLFLIGCEMDSLLDHVVLMGRKWKGKVRVDVISDAPHAFDLLPMAWTRDECRVISDHFQAAIRPHDS